MRYTPVQIPTGSWRIRDAQTGRTLSYPIPNSEQDAIELCKVGRGLNGRSRGRKK